MKVNISTSKMAVL